MHPALLVIREESVSHDVSATMLSGEQRLVSTRMKKYVADTLTPYTHILTTQYYTMYTIYRYNNS